MDLTDLTALEWKVRWARLQHDFQMVPEGDWTEWLLLAGRGAGKTRGSAEIVSGWAWDNPGTRWLVAAPTKGDLRATCFEGESGLLNVIPPHLIERTLGGGLWNSSLAEIKLKNGSLLKGLSADEPERFRGPQFHGGWIDEICAWSDPEGSYEMIEYTMRLGEHPRLLISTTPKPTPFVKSLVAKKGNGLVITSASTYVNKANLAPSFLEKLREKEGTSLGRQEIHAEILDSEEGGIVKRNSIRLWPAKKPLPKFEYICVSFDTAFTEEDFNKKKQTADPTACTIWGVFYHPDRKRMCVLLLDAWEDHISFDDLRVKALAESKAEWGNEEFSYISGKRVSKGKKPDIMVIEAKGSGISLSQSMEREGVLVHRYDPGKLSKLTRLHLVSHLFAGGVIYMKESGQRPGKPVNWTEPLLNQLCSYIGEGSTTHDDWVDSTSQALLLLIQHLNLTVTTKADRNAQEDEDREPVEELPKGNPYDT